MDRERCRRIFDDVPRRKRSRRNSVTERKTLDCQASALSSAVPTPAPTSAPAFVATRLNGLRQDDAGLSGSSTGSCSSPDSSTGSNSVPAPVPSPAPAGSCCCCSSTADSGSAV
ncbi:hypothetical protein AtNW77_Chr2g0251931 [Arabidopsis thaliana]|uniref:Uncharacterized protein n=4 Tax=Arabidopsis TaxID=3701 RepID=A0A178VWU6_ARATH|nr:uncharacterized protein AT2G31850 [Arabidopsis thaliana]KAG7638138.1 hypothetical protein ISN45_At02g026150 [Arabidopsis thaliana x Arabidopsis arenosa]KAG7642762.1 hypothetical protein ISN44_As02g026450 [Arabidopsis suecica]AAD32287.1 hypothetical protein [Arabidopsis thaliana]AEC08593.1 hypothetical protein AT2G31850 [Arabidopsis thaliana]OAP10306.1 hypothetical protein AXX17_AT2G28060 [Arabidopsis thaliana]|eukprot:NP_180744.1 hypothetical protein AT2G31850 [Arabidopsis thaliana]